MDFADVVRRRRMVRAFDSARPIPAETLNTLLDQALRAPSAGNAQGCHFVVLEGAGETARFWDASLPAQRREGFAWPGLLDAAVLVLPVAEPAAYLARYAEADKAGARGSGGLALGGDRSAWGVPYWLTDTAFATMTLLLGAVDAGLGACFFGLFEQEPAVREALGLPDDTEPLGVVALGYPAPDRPGRSATRPKRPPTDRIHRSQW